MSEIENIFFPNSNYSKGSCGNVDCSLDSPVKKKAKLPKSFQSMYENCFERSVFSELFSPLNDPLDTQVAFLTTLPRKNCQKVEKNCSMFESDLFFSKTMFSLKMTLWTRRMQF